MTYHQTGSVVALPTDNPGNQTWKKGTDWS